MCDYDRRFAILTGHGWNKENKKSNSYPLVPISLVRISPAIVVWKYRKGPVITCPSPFPKNCSLHTIDLVGSGITWSTVESQYGTGTPLQAISSLNPKDWQWNICEKKLFTFDLNLLLFSSGYINSNVYMVNNDGFSGSDDQITKFLTKLCI